MLSLTGFCIQVQSTASRCISQDAEEWGWAIHSVYTKKNSIRPPVISLEYSTSIGHIFTRPAAKFSMQMLQGRGLTGCHSSPLLVPFPILRVVIPVAVPNCAKKKERKFRTIMCKRMCIYCYSPEGQESLHRFNISTNWDRRTIRVFREGFAGRHLFYPCLWKKKISSQQMQFVKKSKVSIGSPFTATATPSLALAEPFHLPPESPSFHPLL